MPSPDAPLSPSGETPATGETKPPEQAAAPKQLRKDGTPYRYHKVSAKDKGTAHKLRNEKGQLLRLDGQVDFRSRSRHADGVGASWRNTSGLIKGWPDGMKKREEKKAERESKLLTREGLLSVLREIAADEEEGPARMKAIELLLKPDAGDTTANIPVSVKDWIANVDFGDKVE